MFKSDGKLRAVMGSICRSTEARIEKLEDRRLLSAAPVLSGGIGAAGDSYTDEYQFYPPDRSTAQNFVELLAADRGFDFGALSTVGRPAPRNQGFEYDWAQSGDTSTDMLADGQISGLANQIHSGNVGMVFLFIGGNDFRDVFTSPDPLAALQTVVPTALNNIGSALNTILSASPTVKVVVATAANVAFLPEARAAVAAGLLPQALLDAVGQAVDGFNSQLRVMAQASDRVAVADIGGLMTHVFAMSKLKIDGIDIDRYTPEDDPTHLFLADGIHAGTVGQGLIANQFIRAMDEGFGMKVKRFTPRELVEMAGLRHYGKSVFSHTPIGHGRHAA
jgi:lysophospholipase L1-like esterase